MSEATEYLLENYIKTFDIYNAIGQMEIDVLTKFDEAIREVFSDWFEDDWVCIKEENLQDDYCINVIRKEWSFRNDKDEIHSYIWAYLVLEGDDPIWTFFGLPSEDEGNCVKIEIWLSKEFKQLQNFQDLIEEFDEKNQDLLEEAGFSKKGGKVNRTYEMPIHFSNSSILKGIKNNDWDEATTQLKKAWQNIEKVDWLFLKKAINQHKK